MIPGPVLRLPPPIIVLLGAGLACAGGPAGPATSEESPVTDPAAARYRAWLTDEGANVDPDTIKAVGSRGLSGWTFFMVSKQPGDKRHTAAVSGDAVVSPGSGAHWGAFLRAGEPDRVHQAIGWLQGAWAVTGPDDPSAAEALRDFPQLEGQWAGPAVTEADGVVRFEAWYGEPPSFEPFRFVVEAPTGGEATFSRHRPE